MTESTLTFDDMQLDQADHLAHLFSEINMAALAAMKNIRTVDLSDLDGCAVVEALIGKIGQLSGYGLGCVNPGCFVQADAVTVRTWLLP